MHEITHLQYYYHNKKIGNKSIFLTWPFKTLTALSIQTLFLYVAYMGSFVKFFFHF